MLSAAVKTASTNNPPIFLVVIFVAIIALSIFVFVRGRMNAKKDEATAMRVEGKVVASRIQARIKGSPRGGPGIGIGGAVGNMQNGNGTIAEAGVGVGPNGISSHVGVHRSISSGLNLLPFHDRSDVDYDVRLSVEYVDPVTGKTRLATVPSSMAEVANRLPKECHVLESATYSDVIDPNAIADGFSAIKAAMEESKRIREAGGSGDDISKHFNDAQSADQTGFTFLHNPVPVKLSIIDRSKSERRVLYEF